MRLSKTAVVIALIGASARADWNFGSFQALKAKAIAAENGVWEGFIPEDPVLWMLRVESRVGGCDPQRRNLVASPWGEWSDNERSAVVDCTSAPCKVKLDAKEAAALAAVEAPARPKRYLELVESRVKRFTLGQIDRYEFDEKPRDLAALLAERGFAMTKPTRTEERRKYGFLQRDDVFPIRQVLLVATQGAVTRKTAAYTDHYFESWVEWQEWDCSDKGRATLLLILGVELDLLKKNDLFSRLARGSMRSAVESGAREFLKKTAQSAFK